jgi:hypothetical protein
MPVPFEVRRMNALVAAASEEGGRFTALLTTLPTAPSGLCFGPEHKSARGGVS